MENMRKGLKTTNWIDFKLGFTTSSREKYNKNPKKYDDLAKGTTYDKYGFLLLEYDVRKPETNEIVVKGEKDYWVSKGVYDFTLSLSFEKSEEYVHKFLTDYSQDPPVINQEA